jgi:hypothetical protein
MKKSLIVIIATSALTGALVTMCVNEIRKPFVNPAARSVAPISKKEQDIVNFYMEHRSPDPFVMARATAKAKRPRLMAAVAVVESNANPKAIGKAGEKGAWQVIEEEWGIVPDDAEGQCKQAEGILEELLEASEGKLKGGLSKYNGDRTGKYAQKVLAKVDVLKLK